MRNALADYHEQILGIADRAEPLVRAGRDSGRAEELGPMRMAMARTITSYQLFVHREVFEPLLVSGNATWVNSAKALKIECILLAEDFRGYARLWGNEDYLVRWDEYQPASLAMIERIRQHVAAVRHAELPKLGTVQPAEDYRLSA